LIVICQHALASAARRKAELRQGELIRRYHEVVNTMNAFPVYIGLNSFFKSIVVEHLEKLEDYERSRRYGEAAEIANAIGKRFENIGEGALALLWYVFAIQHPGLKTKALAEFCSDLAKAQEMAGYREDAIETLRFVKELVGESRELDLRIWDLSREKSRFASLLRHKEYVGTKKD